MTIRDDLLAAFGRVWGFTDGRVPVYSQGVVEHLLTECEPIVSAALAEAERRADQLRAALKGEHETHRMTRVAHVGGTDYICGLCQQEPRSQYDPVWPCEAVKRIDAALVAAEVSS